jgi:hypothetical protein
MVGRVLILLGVLVVVATLLDAFGVFGSSVAVTVIVVGLLLAAGQTWWLLRRAWVVRLSPAGYAVRLLQGVGVTGAPWSEVSEAVAATPEGQACLVMRLRDGRTTIVPMAALAGDREAFAREVRRRLRDAHTPADAAGPDSAATDQSL